MRKHPSDGNTQGRCSYKTPTTLQKKNLTKPRALKTCTVFYSKCKQSHGGSDVDPDPPDPYFFQIRIKIMWIQIQHQKCAPQLTQMKYLFKASVYRDFRALFFQQSTPT